MHLHQRPVRRDELAACFEHLGEPWAFPAAFRTKVPGLLERWHQQGCLIGHVIEDVREFQTPQTVGLSLIVFVRPGFADDYRAGRIPFARAELVRREFQGESVVLNTREIRAANQSGGLVLLYFNHGLTNRALDEAALHLVHARWGDTFAELRGFRLKEILVEVHSALVRDWGLACGMNPRHACPGLGPVGSDGGAFRIFLAGLDPR
ncbi:MAG: hypothetical protein E1N59_2255 [Puniceicoccaceae bacterium 5H]|nr:MAG: hypothetical protein E1N59_2255 [Puniceicoccaceae bacterium 5H]